MSDDKPDFVPVEPAPAAAQPVAPPVPPVAPAAAPPGYSATQSAPPQYGERTTPQYGVPPQQQPQQPQGYPGQQAYPGAYTTQYPQQYAYAPPQPKGLGIASMVLGIVSIVISLYGIGLFPAIAAIITGHLGRRRQPAARGFALAGLITGYIGLLFAVLWIIGIVAVIATHGSIIGHDFQQGFNEGYSNG